MDYEKLWSELEKFFERAQDWREFSGRFIIEKMKWLVAVERIRLEDEKAKSLRTEASKDSDVKTSPEV